MANIESLKRSITQMPYNEAIMVIRECRDSRRIAKVMAKKKGNKKASRVIDPFNAVKTMAGVMTDEQKAELKRKLMEE